MNIQTADTLQKRVRPLEGAPEWLGVYEADAPEPLSAFAFQNADALHACLQTYPALLLRGFDLKDIEEFERFSKAMLPDLIPYLERSSPRTELRSGILTTTEYPAHQQIPLHNELSYSANWPQVILFCCLHPAETGGGTTLGDSREVFQRLPEDLVNRFKEKGVMYVRNYQEGMDVPWTDAFQTEDRQAVNAWCEQESIDAKWLTEDHLRTIAPRHAVISHPRTGDPLWFNQAHLFHCSSLGPEMAEALRSIYHEEDLPRHAFFGDGSPLDEDDLQAIRDAYEAVTYPVAWEQGDALIVDNLRLSHGREPFTGRRHCLVAMGKPTNAEALGQG